MTKKPTKKRIDASRIILTTGVVVMAIFIVALCWIGAMLGNMIVLFYALPYVVVAGYSLLVINRLEVTSAIIKRMTILASIFGTLSSIFLLIAFAVVAHVF